MFGGGCNSPRRGPPRPACVAAPGSRLHHHDVGGVLHGSMASAYIYVQHTWVEIRDRLRHAKLHAVQRALLLTGLPLLTATPLLLPSFLTCPPSWPRALHPVPRALQLVSYSIFVGVLASLLQAKAAIAITGSGQTSGSLVAGALVACVLAALLSIRGMVHEVQQVGACRQLHSRWLSARPACASAHMQHAWHYAKSVLGQCTYVRKVP